MQQAEPESYSIVIVIGCGPINTTCYRLGRICDQDADKLHHSTVMQLPINIGTPVS